MCCISISIYILFIYIYIYIYIYITRWFPLVHLFDTPLQNSPCGHALTCPFPYIASYLQSCSYYSIHQKPKMKGKERRGEAPPPY